MVACMLSRTRCLWCLCLCMSENMMVNDVMHYDCSISSLNGRYPTMSWLVDAMGAGAFHAALFALQDDWFFLHMHDCLSCECVRCVGYVVCSFACSKCFPSIVLSPDALLGTWIGGAMFDPLWSAKGRFRELCAFVLEYDLEPLVAQLNKFGFMLWCDWKVLIATVLTSEVPMVPCHASEHVWC